MDAMHVPPHLRNLNDAQLRAVTFDQRGSLQILAGPGSGKTRALTCRVAYLVKDCGLDPKRLLVCTFTNKAAAEMKHRLKLLLGEATANKIVAGTFHSICVRFLRRHGHLIGLAPNWVIADHSDCQSIIKQLTGKAASALPSLRDGEKVKWDAPKPSAVAAVISKSKAKNLSADQYFAREKAAVKDDNPLALRMAEFVHRVWEGYDEALAKDNALDFDDLLTYTERLLRENAHAAEPILHVLCDEYQDTNTVQYLLVKHFATATKALTVVGDPDQSIYGWRSAEIGNILLMQTDFQPTTQIFLEQNYRSTGRILAAALAVVKQDKSRIDKSLFTSHPSGQSVVLRQLTNGQDEATFIASEIKRLVAHTGGLLTFDDFAILVRFNAQSRAVEAALKAAKIAHRIIVGHAFFDRIEIKDMLAYLQVVDNPGYVTAFRRAINVPKRGMGEKSIDGIVKAAERKKISPFEVVSRAVRGSSLGDIKPAQKKALKPFVKLIEHVRAMAVEGGSVADMIAHIVTAVEYKDHLMRVHGPDADERMDNIEELKAYAKLVAVEQKAEEELFAPDAPAEAPAPVAPPPPVSIATGANDDDAISINSFSADEETEAEGTPAPLASEKPTELRNFLAAFTLSSTAETEDSKDDQNQPKVTISTCHAAKGLEWPVVFIPQVEAGTFPSFRAEGDEHGEETRLLYVAMTRAQSSLYLTHVNARMTGYGSSAKPEHKQLSPFIAEIARSTPPLFSNQPDHLDAAARELMAKLMNRRAVDEKLVANAIESHTALAPKVAPQSQGPLAGTSYSAFNGRPLVTSSSGYQPYSRTGALAGPSLNGGQRAAPMPTPLNAGFQSARSLVPKPTFAPLPRVNAQPAMRVTTAETRLSQTGGVGALLNPKVPEPVAPIGLGTFTSASNDALAAFRSLAAEERAAPSSKAFVPPLKRTSSAAGPPPKRPKP